IEVPEVLELTTNNDLDQSSCDSGELVLGVETNGTVGWTDQDGNLLGTGDSLRIDATGLNRITATAIDESGCTQTLTFEINQYMFDITTDAPTEPVCDSDGNGLIITATDGTGANLSYQWTSAGGIISGSNSPVVTVDPTMSQDLQLEVTNQDLGCSITISVPVTGGSLDGSITSDPVDGNIRRTESATLTVDPMGDNITYQWDDGNTDGVRTVTPLETTTYTVTITDNDTGCTDIESVTINVEQPICDEPEIFIPLAFSPNGDGENDELIVRGNIIETVDLQVLDRWGREVFRGQRVGEGWNGQHRNTGDDLSPDMYAYCLKVVCSDGTEFLKSGSISLVR
ncbi:MAG: gliding motility-associated C-terminal domain-containing protein, partial [Bacteroidota bacterium]